LVAQKVPYEIFQPYFTAKPTWQQTGLGLSLPCIVIKAHAGELKVETVENKETNCSIVLSL
jgi:C4-dicarboxylate-specific signal transduction histidine kinase